MTHADEARPGARWRVTRTEFRSAGFLCVRTGVVRHIDPKGLEKEGEAP